MSLYLDPKTKEPFIWLVYRRSPGGRPLVTSNLNGDLWTDEERAMFGSALAPCGGPGTLRRPSILMLGTRSCVMDQAARDATDPDWLRWWP